MKHGFRVGGIARAVGVLALLAAVLLASLNVRAMADPVREVESRVNRLMVQGDYDRALALAEEGWPASTPNRANRIDFIRAMSLKHQGRYIESAALMRSILAANPGFARVRAELAHSLFLAGDYDAARFHFADLSRNAESAPLRDAFESYLSAIRVRQPNRLSAYVSLAPSTNINDRTSARTIMVNGLPFTLSDGSRAVSGIGLNGGVTGERNFFVSETMTASLSGRFDGTKFRQTEFDRLQVAGSAFLRHKAGTDTFGAGFVADYANLGHRTYKTAFGLAVEYGRQLSGGRDLFASARIMRQDYPDQPAYDGYRATATLLSRQPLGAGQHLTAGVRLGSEHTRVRHLDNVEAGIFLAHTREWNGGLITQVEPQLTFRRYAAADPIFGIRRQDTQAGITLRASHRKLSYGGFAPRLDYTYLRQFSNHPLHGRDSHGINLVLTREF